MRSIRFLALFDVNVSKTVNTLVSSFPGGVLFWGVFDKDVLAALGYLPEYPTCSKAVGWYGVRCCVYFARSIEPSLQNGSVPRNGFMFLDYWTGRATGVRPLRL